MLYVICDMSYGICYIYIYTVYAIHIYIYIYSQTYTYICIYTFPKVPGRTFFPWLPKIVTFAAAPLVRTPFVRNFISSYAKDNTTPSDMIIMHTMLSLSLSLSLYIYIYIYI